MAKATTNLTRAFADLRKQGLFARQNFTCCQSCGWAAAASLIEASAGKKKVPMGCVFYHAQDADDLRDGRDFYLAFGGNIGTTNMPAESIGNIVVQVLTQHGVKTEWNGSGSTRIKVIASSVN